MNNDEKEGELEEATLEISVARNNLPALVDLLDGQERVLRVVRYNKPVLAILSWEMYKHLIGKAEESDENDFERELRLRLEKGESEKGK